MTRYKATISYDGYSFAGFQRQTHARSVQEEIEKTLTKLNKGKAITVHGAGRTDSGVHALGQVIHFDLPHQMDEEKLRFALDTQSPEDIDVISIELVADDFIAVMPSTARPMSLLWIGVVLKIPCAVTMLLTFPTRLTWNACRLQSKARGHPRFHRLYSFWNQCGG